MSDLPNSITINRKRSSENTDSSEIKSMEQEQNGQDSKNYVEFTSTWTIVRHGQTNCNIQNIIQGQSVPALLAENGRFQARKLGDFLKNEKDFEHNSFEKCYCSDLIRAKETALGLLGQYHGEQFNEPKGFSEKEVQKMNSIQEENCLAEPNQEYLKYLDNKSSKICELRSDSKNFITYDNLLRERSFGEKEGQSRTSFGMVDSGAPLPLNAESRKQLAARMRNFIVKMFKNEGLLSDFEKPDSNVLLVSHGGAIKVLLEQIFYNFEDSRSVPAEKKEVSSSSEETLLNKRNSNLKLLSGTPPNTSRTVIKFSYKMDQNLENSKKARKKAKKGDQKNFILPGQFEDFGYEILKIYDVSHLE